MLLGRLPAHSAAARPAPIASRACALPTSTGRLQAAHARHSHVAPISSSSLLQLGAPTHRMPSLQAAAAATPVTKGRGRQTAKGIDMHAIPWETLPKELQQVAVYEFTDADEVDVMCQEMLKVKPPQKEQGRYSRTVNPGRGCHPITEEVVDRIRRCMAMFGLKPRHKTAKILLGFDCNVQRSREHGDRANYAMRVATYVPLLDTQRAKPLYIKFLYSNQVYSVALQPGESLLMPVEASRPAGMTKILHWTEFFDKHAVTVDDFV